MLPFLVFGPMAAVLDLAPVWRAVHLPVAGLWLVSLYALWAVLRWPDWLRYRPIVSVLPTSEPSQSGSCCFAPGRT